MNEKTVLMMVTYNRLELTKQTINSLYSTVYRDFDLVIVDNGSSDGTFEYLTGLAKERNNIHLKFNKENKGIAVGRNQGLKMAEELGAEFLSTIDNDVLFPDNWLDKCIDILIANTNYAMIGVSFEPTVYPIVNLNSYEFERKPKGNLGTACMVFNKKLLKLVGYFTTEYAAYGEEDADYGMRVRATGLQLGYIKEHGQHIGEGENDVGEYREFKDECRKKNLALFYQNCRDYMSGKKPIYIPFKE